MGGGGKCGDEDRGNGTGAGGFLQINRAVGVFIWEQELCGDSYHDKSTRVITSSGNQTYCRDDGAAYDEWILVVVPGG